MLNFQDVTETVRLKEQLRQSETMAEIGSIVAGVAHEVRNPLFSISATLDAFESRFGKTEGFERYLSVLRGEIVRLTDAHAATCSTSAGPAGPTSRECRMEEVVEAAVSACAPLARRKSVEIAWPRGAAAPPVLADRARVSQVLQNLIENAVHFSPQGGRVEVRRTGTDERWVECAVGTRARLRPADLPRLFEPFFTRRRGGTGSASRSSSGSSTTTAARSPPRTTRRGAVVTVRAVGRERAASRAARRGALAGGCGACPARGRAPARCERGAALLALSGGHGHLGDGRRDRRDVVVGEAAGSSARRRPEGQPACRTSCSTSTRTTGRPSRRRGRAVAHPGEVHRCSRGSGPTARCAGSRRAARRGWTDGRLRGLRGRSWT